MSLYRISDIDMTTVQETNYDLVVFASGYEQRATFVAEHLGRGNTERALIIGFRELDRAPQRKANDRYYVSKWGGDSLTLGADEDGPIYEYLRGAFGCNRDSVSVLVDYSSMSRLWYAAILNWARYARGPREIVIDLLYSVGEHRDETPALVIDDILAIPGCEGGAISLSKAVGVFGLGFDGMAPLCVLDRLEPDEVYAYLASPAAFADYPKRARDANYELINRHARETLELPLGSVESTFSHLAELIMPHREEADITFIPMGPKPHVLAAILLAIRFEEITCLRVSGKRSQPERVAATGVIVGTRSIFRGGKVGLKKVPDTI